MSDMNAVLESKRRELLAQIQEPLAQIKLIDELLGTQAAEQPAAKPVPAPTATATKAPAPKAQPREGSGVSQEGTIKERVLEHFQRDPTPRSVGDLSRILDVNAQSLYQQLRKLPQFEQSPSPDANRTNVWRLKSGG